MFNNFVINLKFNLYSKFYTLTDEAYILYNNVKHGGAELICAKLSLLTSESTSDNLLNVEAQVNCGSSNYRGTKVGTFFYCLPRSLCIQAIS